jgi:transposase
MAYDEKFRLRVIQYKDSGHTFAQIYEAFGVRPRSYYVWKAEFEKKGKFENRYPKNRPGKTDSKKLRELAEKHPDWYLREFAAELGVCFQAIDKKFKALGITRKKKLLLIRKRAKKNGKST